MNRRRFLYSGLSMLGLVLSGPASAIPVQNLCTELALLDNAIDTTRMQMNLNYGLRIAMLGLDPRKFKTFERVRAYARETQPHDLFNRAALLVEFRQKVVDAYGIDAVAASMDSREPFNDAEAMFSRLLRASGYKHFGEGNRDWYPELRFDDDFIYYGDIRPAA